MLFGYKEPLWLYLQCASLLSRKTKTSIHFVPNHVSWSLVIMKNEPGPNQNALLPYFTLIPFAIFSSLPLNIAVASNKATSVTRSAMGCFPRTKMQLFVLLLVTLRLTRMNSSFSRKHSMDYVAVQNIDRTRSTASSAPWVSFLMPMILVSLWMYSLPFQPFRCSHLGSYHAWSLC